jgi:TonB family protein
MRCGAGRTLNQILGAILAIACCVHSSSAAPEPPWGKTVDGKVFRAKHGDKQPWVDDAINKVGPSYPYADRVKHHQGSGRFRMILDPKTGRVTDVRIYQSTGYQSLDQSVLAALRQWRWKPGKWKEIDFPVNFTMTTGPRPLPAGAVPLPQSKKAN